MKFICQNCNRVYEEADSKAGRQDMFCMPYCQQHYLARNGRLPLISSEIPLGEPEACNLWTFPHQDPEANKPPAGERSE